MLVSRRVWKIVLFAIALLCFGAAMYFYVKSKMVANTEKIIFLTDSETQEVLNGDADHYYQTFNKVDLKVRKSKTMEDYLVKIANSGCFAMEENKEKIVDCIERVQTQLTPRRNEVIDGIQIGKLLDLEWRIGFTCDDIYESGLPHTRGNVIILNNLDIQRRTLEETCQLLIHEKVHVYQKTYAEETNAHLTEHFDIVKKKSDNARVPANPDVDENIYKRKQDGKILESEYVKKPTHFRDVKFPDGDHTQEHPFEMTAYKLESLYKNN